jgi:chromosome segregation ATPase
MTSGLQRAASVTDVMSPAPVTKSRARGRGSQAARGATAAGRGRKTRAAAGASGARTKAATATPAGQSLDRAQHALDQAAQMEKQLRASLKEHIKAVSAAKDDLDRRDRDLKAMKSQLKTAKKSCKHAARELSQASKTTAAAMS